MPPTGKAPNHCPSWNPSSYHTVPSPTFEYFSKILLYDETQQGKEAGGADRMRVLLLRSDNASPWPVLTSTAGYCTCGITGGDLLLVPCFICDSSKLCLFSLLTSPYFLSNICCCKFYSLTAESPSWAHWGLTLCLKETRVAWSKLTVLGILFSLQIACVGW